MPEWLQKDIVTEIAENSNKQRKKEKKKRIEEQGKEINLQTLTYVATSQHSTTQLKHRLFHRTN